jgi:hypothetical protein
MRASLPLVGSAELERRCILTTDMGQLPWCGAEPDARRIAYFIIALPAKKLALRSS